MSGRFGRNGNEGLGIFPAAGLRRPCPSIVQVLGLDFVVYLHVSSNAVYLFGAHMNNYEQTTQEVRDAFNALCKGRVEAAVKAEREACAQLAEMAEPYKAADLIRARGTHEA